MNKKKILLGICGSIAAYKVCDLIRQLKQSKHEVKCILTSAGEKFITPLTLKTLSGNIVYKDMFEYEVFEPHHVALATWADVIVVVPATANTIAKIACGIADDLLSCVVLATERPVIICPAMNTRMWLNQITQENIHRLKKRNFIILGPEEGKLICEEGIGRLISIDKIVKKIETL